MGQRRGDRTLATDTLAESVEEEVDDAGEGGGWVTEEGGGGGVVDCRGGSGVLGREGGGGPRGGGPRGGGGIFDGRRPLPGFG